MNAAKEKHKGKLDLEVEVEVKNSQMMGGSRDILKGRGSLKVCVTLLRFR